MHFHVVKDPCQVTFHSIQQKKKKKKKSNQIKKITFHSAFFDLRHELGLFSVFFFFGKRVCFPKLGCCGLLVRAGFTLVGSMLKTCFP